MQTNLPRDMIQDSNISNTRIRKIIERKMILDEIFNKDIDPIKNRQLLI